MNWPDNPLELDPQDTCLEIIAFIQDHFRCLDRQLAIIGVSGGLDSSLTAVLAARALGKTNIHLINIPERDSNPIHKQHSRILADYLGIDLHRKSITLALRSLGVYGLLPLGFIPVRKLREKAVDYGREHLLKGSQGEFLSLRLSARGGSWVARGNAYASAKHRLRSVILYKEAERRGGLVIGSANRTEWLTGTFTKWGCDHCADLMPLIHLYRSQLEILAKHLSIPSEILNKKADPDVLPGVDNKGSLLGSFEVADHILWGIENGFSREFLSERYDPDQVSYIYKLYEYSDHYRKLPYSLL